MRIVLLLTVVIVTVLSIDDRARRVDGLFREFDVPTSAGASVSIVQDGKFLYQSFYGNSELRTPVKINKDTVFLVASVTKQFTATGVALLQQRRLLNVHDSIYKYLPADIKPIGNITILNLIQHTSGIRDYLNIAALAGQGGHFDFTRDEALEYFKVQETLMFAPGTNWSYSNTGYLILEYIIEKVTNIPFSQYMDQAIFKPLGMKNTVIATDRQVPIRNSAYGHQIGTPQKYYSTINNNIGGTGGLQITAEDFLKWDSNHYNNILGGGPELIKMITTPGYFNNGTQHFYAYGIGRANIGGQDILTHTGLWAGYVAYMARVPEKRLTVLVMANLENQDIYKKSFDVLKIYLGIQSSKTNSNFYQEGPVMRSYPPQKTHPKGKFIDYVGFYHCPELKGVLKVKLDKNQLYFDFRYYPRGIIVMKPNQRHHFWIGQEYGFNGLFVENGAKIVGLHIIDFDRAWNLRCTKLSQAPIC